MSERAHDDSFSEPCDHDDNDWITLHDALQHLLSDYPNATPLEICFLANVTYSPSVYPYYFYATARNHPQPKSSRSRMAFADFVSRLEKVNGRYVLPPFDFTGNRVYAVQKMSTEFYAYFYDNFTVLRELGFHTLFVAKATEDAVHVKAVKYHQHEGQKAKIEEIRSFVKSWLPEDMTVCIDEMEIVTQ